MSNIGGGSNNNNAANIHAYLQGLEELPAEEFAEFGVNIPRQPRTETEYLLSLIGDSLWLHAKEYRYLLTEGQLNRTDILPPIVQPSELYLVPTALVLNGIQDGYLWESTKHHKHMIDDGPLVHGMYSYQKDVGPVPGRVLRRIIFVSGNHDVLLIHYKVEKLNRNTGKLY